MRFFGSRQKFLSDSIVNYQYGVDLSGNNFLDAGIETREETFDQLNENGFDGLFI